MIERQKERYGWEFLFLGANIDAVRHAAKLSAEVTHNHPEGIKGAEATAAAIFLARTGCSKAEIKEYIEHEFGYALNRTCDEIRPNYHHTETSRARCLTLREFETPMELHCSQTDINAVIGALRFETPMELHCSQTP